MASFAHLLLLENRKSTNIEASRKYMAAIRAACPDVSFDTMQIQNKTFGGFNKKLQKGTLLCVAGGDGTVSSVVQELLENGHLTQAQRHTPILPVWGGNANDLAHMLNGRPSPETCTNCIGQGEIVPIYPLRCTIKSDGKKRFVRLAACYVSFGATAQAALQFNGPAFRENPLNAVPGGKALTETVLSIKALRDTPTFVVEQDGERKIIYDWIISKGSRMARLGHLPVELTDQAFYQSVVEHKSLPEVVNRAVSLVWGRLPSGTGKRPVTFTTTEPIWAQFDGEPLQLSTSTTVKIELNPQPFYVLSTLLKK